MKENIQTLDRKISLPTIPINMYEISGRNKISTKSYHRYLHDSLEIKNISLQPQINRINDDYIQSVPLDQRGEIIKKGLLDNDIEVRKVSLSNLHGLPQKNRDELDQQALALIENTLSTDDSKLQKDYLIIMSQVFLFEKTLHIRNQIIKSIEKSLSGKNIEDQKKTLPLIDFVPLDKKIIFIKEALKVENIEIQRIAACAINPWMNGDEISQLKNKISDLIQIAISNPDPNVQKNAVMMIKSASNEKRGELENQVVNLIEKYLSCDDLKDQQIGLDMTFFLREELRKKMTNLILTKPISQSLIESPLYKSKNISKDIFSRTKFEKTGSQLILFGGSLKEKTVLRQIIPSAFLVWQKAFNNYQMWQEEGFDYVPIEPIHSFKLNKNGLVDVYSGVLDLNFYNWSQMTNLFTDELFEDQERIIKILNQNKIEHGHLHVGNFCLRFFRNESGEIDFTQKPRTYLIDFDQATLNS
ncbi:MAG: hypothetical protein PHE71_03035 [Candidatus Shapirobacteria bacterium]|nr:hypothetical protein [Candidatus Shapirobacteria bacterium]